MENIRIFIRVLAGLIVCTLIAFQIINALFYGRMLIPDHNDIWYRFSDHIIAFPLLIILHIIFGLGVSSMLYLNFRALMGWRPREFITKTDHSSVASSVRYIAYLIAFLVLGLYLCRKLAWW